MPRPRPVVPPYRHHKARDLAFTIVNGRTIYLGPHGSPASREKHARIIHEAAIAGVVGAVPSAAARIDPASVTVAAMMAAYWSHAKAYYTYDASYDGKRPPGEIGSYHDVIKVVLKLYAGTPAVDFDAKALRLVQREMMAMDWCRNVINRASVRLRSIFKWAAGEGGLLPTEVHLRLAAVPGLRRGHKGARDTAKVLPVPADVLAATLAQMSPRQSAMVRLQLLTGMRSGNLCDMRTADVDTAGGADGTGAWVYRPRQHKNQHRGHDLAIRIGPKAQAVLRPYLKPHAPDAFIFSPAEEVAELRAARSATRKVPASCGNKPGSNVKRSPRKVPGDHYTPGSYAQAVKRACHKANRWAKGGMIIGDAERAVPHWHPHQLRHNRGTVVRARHGTDGVLAALGAEDGSDGRPVRGDRGGEGRAGGGGPGVRQVAFSTPHDGQRRTDHAVVVSGGLRPGKGPSTGLFVERIWIALAQALT